MDVIRPLPAHLQEVASSELNENPATVAADIQALRQWLVQNPNITSRLDAQFLVAFLRGCKYSLERAKEKIELYYTSRFVAPEFFNGQRWKDDRIIELLMMKLCVPFPLTETPDGPRVVLIRCASFDPKLVHVREIMRMAVMMNDILMLEDDNFLVSGLVNVIDMDGASKSLSYISQFNPTLVKNISFVTQDALPVRTKGIHFLNPPPTFDSVFSFFKSLFNKKNVNRLALECHGTKLDSLFEFIPKRLFPSEYGGDAGTMEEICADWREKFRKYEAYFEEDEEYKMLERGKSVEDKLSTVDFTFGHQGSFRKLNVD